MKRPSKLAYFTLILVVPVGCKHADYENLTKPQIAEAKSFAVRQNVNADDWLKIQDIQKYRERFPQRWATPDQVNTLLGLLKSSNPTIRQASLGDLSDPKTQGDKATAFQIMERMTSDPDPYVSMAALLLLAKAGDPNAKHFAEQRLQVANLSEGDKRWCDNIVAGRPLNSK